MNPNLKILRDLLEEELELFTTIFNAIHGHFHPETIQESI